MDNLLIRCGKLVSESPKETVKRFAAEDRKLILHDSFEKRSGQIVTFANDRKRCHSTPGD